MVEDRPSGGPSKRRYSQAERDRAVRAVFQLRRELWTGHGTIKTVADQLGIGSESLRRWVKIAELNMGVARAKAAPEGPSMCELTCCLQRYVDACIGAHEVS